MIEWAEHNLKPYIEIAPENIILLLSMDSYWCPMMASVMEAIQQLSVEVEHIHGGCISLC